MRYLLTAFLILAPAVVLPQSASAARCAAGSHAAGCVGPRGNAVATGPNRTAVAGPNRAAVSGPRGTTVTTRPVAPSRHYSCASGPYRAGCAGPNGAAVVRH